MICAGQAYRAVPITGALGCAAALDGSIVAECLSATADPGALRIGKPSGIVTIGAERDHAS